MGSLGGGLAGDGYGEENEKRKKDEIGIANTTASNYAFSNFHETVFQDPVV